MFALEIAGLDPNLEGIYGRTPLGIAAVIGFLKGVAILIECGAVVNYGEASPYGTRMQSLCRNWSSTAITHYLLFKGADPRPKDAGGSSAWDTLWDAARLEINSTSFSFIELEGRLGHFLLHGLDPFVVLNTAGPILHTSKLYLRAPEMARAWSYGINWSNLQRMQYPERQETLSSFEAAEQTRTPRFTCRWSRLGIIHPWPSEPDKESSQNAEAEETWPTPVESGDEDSQIRSDEPEDQDNRDTFFRDQTQFYHHISSIEGRRQLARFPMALALCDALRYTGYRAEMDDDGDIWYDIDDGDRYFDAQENQVEDVCDDWTARLCPICQDFDRHGLGHILREVEEAKHELREYREKVKAAKHYF
ncbi:hypothetical protein E0Z10_g6679 [Xylaria hypoxylon]|uniref:Uncharacterized protein n=1 Tax=Xylaria hypoxylon TaxID=37992 RepID=A0A4Z0YSM1_9PEZI|nr:hypothetical protein E0Z10_g6679 [Xylaria hypoxylon]